MHTSFSGLDWNEWLDVLYAEIYIYNVYLIVTPCEYTHDKLPNPDKVFSALAHGESFSTIDLARAYKQIKVTAEKQPYLTINTHMGLFSFFCLLLFGKRQCLLYSKVAKE